MTRYAIILPSGDTFATGFEFQTEAVLFAFMAGLCNWEVKLC